MAKGRPSQDGVQPIGRQRAKWLRRQREIYDVAARVFHAKGYEQTSMDDIAESVGLLKGSLYHYIDSKEDLLYGIAESVDRLILESIESNAKLEGHAIDRLYALLHGHTLGTGTDQDFLVHVQVYYHEFRSLTPEHQAEVHRVRRAYENYTRDLIAQAQVEGSLCPDVDVDMMSPAILALLNGVLLAHRVGRPMDWERIADNYVNFVMQGLSCPPDHNHGRRASESGSRPVKKTPPASTRARRKS